MKRNKVKRVLAAALSSMMVLSSIPLSASATNFDPSAPENSGKDYMGVSLKLGTMAKIPETTEVYSSEDFENVNVATGEMVEFTQAQYEKYGGAVYKAGTEDGNFSAKNYDQNIMCMPVNKNTVGQYLSSNIEKANSVFNASETADGTEIEAAPGETVYLALDLDSTHLAENQYLAGFGVQMRADEGLEFTGGGSNLIINNINSGNINMTASNAKDSAVNAWDAYNTMKSTTVDYTVSDAAAGNDSGETTVTMGDTILTVQYTTTNNSSGFSIPQKSTWDVIIPVTVGADTQPGQYKIEYIDGVVSNSNSSFQTYKDASDPFNISNGSSLVAYSIKNEDRVAFNNVVIKVTGPSLEVNTSAVAKDDNQEVQVTLADTNFYEDGVKNTDNWKILDADDSDAEESDVVKSVSFDGLVATLTIDASGLDTAHTYKVKADTGAIGEGSGPAVTSSNTFSVVEAPTATVSYGVDGTVTLNNVTSTMSVKIADDNYKALSGTTYTLNADEMAKLIANPTLKVKYTSDTAEIAVQDVTVNQKTAPAAAPTINYADETTTGSIADTEKYAFGETAPKYSEGTAGSNAAVALDVDTNAGKNLYVFTAGDSSAIASTCVQVAIPARPTYNLPTADDSDKINRNTVISGGSAAQGDKYIVKGSSDGAPNAGDFSSASALGAASDGKWTIAATTAQKIYFMKPATASAFRSAVSEGLVGTGNEHGTATLSATTGDDFITVTLQGAKWNSGNLSGISLKASGETTADYSITNREVTGGDNTVLKITLNKALGNGTVIELDGDSLEAALDGASGATTLKAADGTDTFKVSTSNKVYQPAMGTVSGESDADISLTASPSSVLPGQTSTITFANVDDYNTITAVTVADGKGTVTGSGNTWTYTAPAEEPADLTVVTLNVEVSKKINKITATNIATGLSGLTGKVYDGTDAYGTDGTEEIALDNGTHTGKTDVKVKFTGITYSSADVGTVDIIATGVELTGADVAYYELDGFTTPYTMKSGVTITAATMSKAEGTATVSTSGAMTAEAVKEAIEAVKLTPYYNNGSDIATPEFAQTVGELLNTSTGSDDLDTAIAAAVAAGGYGEATASDVHTKVLTDGDLTFADVDTNGTSGVNQNDTIELDFSGVTDFDTITGYQLAAGADSNITVAANATGATVTVGVGTTNGTFSVEAIDADGSVVATAACTVTVNPAVKTYDIEAMEDGDTLTVNITSALDIANLAPQNYAAFANVNVVVTYDKQTSGGGGVVVGNLVSYEVGENGTIVTGSSSEYVNTGDKPAAVPTVEAKAGYTFMGWSLDKETYVDPATVVINENTTFYAMYQKGYINGYEDGLFYPARNVTRAEFTKMLVMATGLYNGGKTYAATDLKDDKGAWYTNYIACAVEAGIVDGYEDGNFYPDRTITRQEAAKMVYVAMGDVTEVTTTDKITDFDTVSNWAKTYVASLVEADIIAGYEDGTFQPKRLISRAETATMIDRIAGFDPTDEEKAEIASTIAPTFEDVTPDSWAYAYIMFGCGELDDSYYA